MDGKRERVAGLATLARVQQQPSFFSAWPKNRKKRKRRKLTGVLDVHRRRRVGSRDDNRRRHLGVQRGQTRVRHVVDEIGAVVSAGAAYFQFILTHWHHRHFHRVQTTPTDTHHN